MVASRARIVAPITIALGLFLPGAARAQPSKGALGCCCVAKGKAYTCAEKTQADCLAEQPAMPTFQKTEDWKKAWNAWVKASEAQEAQPMRGGWIAGPCEK